MFSVIRGRPPRRWPAAAPAQIARCAPCRRDVTAHPARLAPPIVTRSGSRVTARGTPKRGGVRSGWCARSPAPAPPSTTAARAATRRFRRVSPMWWPGRSTGEWTTAATGTVPAGTPGSAAPAGCSGPVTRPGTSGSRHGRGRGAALGLRSSPTGPPERPSWQSVLPIDDPLLPPTDPSGRPGSPDRPGLPGSPQASRCRVSA